MESGGKPAAVKVSRNGPLRSFQVGTLRPFLSLPSPVSTTMRCFGVSSTSERIDIFSRPSSVAKCGISQGSFWISSLVAAGRMKRVEPTVSISTNFVILTLPTFHDIRRIPKFLLWHGTCAVSAVRRNGSSDAVRRYRGNPRESQRASHARACNFRGEGRLHHREGARVRRQGRKFRSGFRLERD